MDLTDDDLRSLLSGYYGEIGRAFQNQDLEAVAAFISPDFKAVFEDGQTVNYEELLENIRMQFHDLSNIAWPREITSLRQGVERVFVVAEGTYNATNSSGELVSWLLRNEDEWALIDGSWQVVGSKSLD